jgi:D-sedoheptulose 7-phosphate isomerase
VVVRSDYIPRIQEVQASVYHVLRRLIDELARERG